MATLEVLISAGQSNGAGTNADTLSTATVSGAVMLNAIAQVGGSAYNNEFESGGTIDGTCMLWNRLVVASEYTALVALKQEARARLHRPVAPGYSFGVSPDYDSASSAGAAGETIFPALVTYLRARNPTQDYAVLSIAHPGSALSLLSQAGGDLITNATVTFGKLHDLAITAGYSGTVVKLIAMQHGEGDANNASYAAEVETYRSALKDIIVAKNGQSFNPYMVHVQPNRVVGTACTTQLIVATRTNTRMGIAASTHYMPHVNGTNDQHRNGYGQRLTGSLFGRWYDRVITQGLVPRGIRFLPSAFRAANVITVTVDPAWSSVGSLRFLATTENPLQTNFGFQYSDSTTSATISSVAIDSDTTVKITLSNVPTGASQTVNYGLDITSGTLALRGLGNLCDSCTDLGANGETLTNWATRDSIPVTYVSTNAPRKRPAKLNYAR